MHPRLLTTLILLDPVIQSQSVVGPPSEPSIARTSTFRRDLWPSRAAAAVSFAKSPFYQKWDKRVFDRWIQYGLRDLPTAVYPELPSPAPAGKQDETHTPVTLTTTKHQEVWTFLRPNYKGQDEQGKMVHNRKTHADASYEGTYPFYRPEVISTLHKLPFVRPSVLYVLGETSNMSLPELRIQKVQNTGIGVGGSGGAREGRVKEVMLKGVGHLVPMEAADESAEVAAEWVGREMERWREEEREWRESRRGRGRRGDVVVDDEWVRRIGGPFERTKGKL